MKKYALTLIFIWCNSLAFTQNKIDSLKQLLAHSLEDTQSVNVLSELADEFYYFFPDSTYYYASLGLAKAEKLQDLRGEARCKLLMGQGLSLSGNYPKALHWMLQSLKTYEEIGESANIEHAYHELTLLQ